MKPVDYRNWIADTNRFGLPKPPQWWLKRLYDLDNALVVMPSRLRQVYLLGRRRSASLKMPKLVKVDNDLLRMTAGSDGDLLATHQLVYVEKILGGFGNWTSTIFTDLMKRDIWGAGGGDKYADRLDQQDEAARLKTRQDFLSDTDHRAADAWHSYQARTGQRNHHARNSGLRVKSSSSSSTAGSGLVITDA